MKYKTIFFSPFRFVVLLATFLSINCYDTGNSHNGTSYNKPIYNLPTIKGCAEESDFECLDKNEQMLNRGSQMEGNIRDLVEITAEEEKSAGETFYEYMVENYEFIEDKRSKKLNAILQKMLPFVNRKEIKYQIFLVQNKSSLERISNAWTVPGGKIYVTTKMLADIGNDNELANIIGHEIGHNECKHTHTFLQRNKPLKTVIDLFSNMTGVQVESDMFTNLFSLPFIAFGQRNELEADRTGMYLSNKAGYDPKAGLEFWKRNAQNENPNSIETFIRSHPYSNTRYECGTNYLEKHEK